MTMTTTTRTRTKTTTKNKRCAHAYRPSPRKFLQVSQMNDEAPTLGGFLLADPSLPSPCWSPLRPYYPAGTTYIHTHIHTDRHRQITIHPPTHPQTHSHQNTHKRTDMDKNKHTTSHANKLWQPWHTHPLAMLSKIEHNILLDSQGPVKYICHCVYFASRFAWEGIGVGLRPVNCVMWVNFWYIIHFVVLPHFLLSHILSNPLEKPKM